MNYRITQEGPDGVVLSARPERAFPTAISLFFALVGALAALALHRQGAPLALPVGLGALLAALAPLIFLRDRGDPRELHFDNRVGCLFVRGADACALPYAELAGFAVNAEDSSTGSPYVVALRLRDGARWELLGTSSRDQAAELCALLAARVPLSQTAPATTPATAPVTTIDQAWPKALREVPGATLSVAWDEPLRRRVLLFVLLFFATLISLCRAFLLQAERGVTPPHFKAIVWLCLGLGVLLALVVLIQGLRARGTVRSLRVDDRGLLAQSHDGAGVLLKELAMPLGELVAVRVAFTLRAGAGALELVTKETLAADAQIAAGAVDLQLLRQRLLELTAQQLDCATLGAAERLHLARRLTQALRSERKRARLEESPLAPATVAARQKSYL